MQVPGIERGGNFRHIGRIAAGEQSKDDLLTTQDAHDNHFLQS